MKCFFVTCRSKWIMDKWLFASKGSVKQEVHQLWWQLPWRWSYTYIKQVKSLRNFLIFSNVCFKISRQLEDMFTRIDNDQQHLISNLSCKDFTCEVIWQLSLCLCVFNTFMGKFEFVNFITFFGTLLTVFFLIFYFHDYLFNLYF